MEPLLSMQNVVKSFGSSRALKNGQITVMRGEIHALIGANGAGKSTLMKVLYGMLKKDEGTILFDGKEVSFKNVIEAQEAGIFMVHQELQVVKDLTVAENIFLGREPMKGISVDEKTMNRRSEEVLTEIGLSVDPREKMGHLSPAKQQLVVIASLLTRKPKLIILDEPTTALGEEDVEVLFKLMRQFKKDGLSMIFISHRLDELFAVADRITIMRNGSFVISENSKDIYKEQLVYYMTGRSVNMDAKSESAVSDTAPIVLKVENLCTDSYLKNVNFYLRRGEILGFTGLMGSGRTEVARAISGLDPISQGTIYVNGSPVTIHSSVDAMRYGIGYLSEDRNEEGLIYGKSVIFNTAVSSLDRYQGPFGLNDSKIEEDALHYNEQVKTVTSNFYGNIENLSGGNRQKAIIARVLMKDLQILIFDEPTRGIDVGAKEEIYDIIKKLAAEGHSVLLMSSTPEEIRALSDRVMVMYEGTTIGELTAGNLSNENMMRLMTGAGEN